ncbi:hypothetical protein CLAFUW4_14436 [Fulvia fulva]|uniref:Glyoxalase/fosfomycin resistance/dioxygenase domain-containing protein n=1 Tax=Passalora fulva TaxID=5499 RepID=A0A9Q8PMJ1_PASFU|nr:uncharacterized protein CLAFUR5_14268 [Fulvia fulva]KAK4609319.1 hypothetical protein CLAFUR4_14431 [Fulvia fulva]UJO25168.1 hypothetical protein CLAFUR5_14268 [Fulvia fulva]WPV22711.1 hypothetical protein CLAFUW4_14436 [Fulvia fulva]WPV37694.1 hypothetical protein CLAFUW7_14440 [Fulvia fulva]
MCPRPPIPSTILETCLYVRSLSASKAFYGDLIGLVPDVKTERLISYPVGPTSTLLLFKMGETTEDWPRTNANANKSGKPICIPASGPTKEVEKAVLSGNERLNLHFCFGTEKREDTEAWEAYFEEKGVEVIGRMEWERGGYSVYVRDPDGGVVEFGSRGLWPHF